MRIAGTGWKEYRRLFSERRVPEGMMVCVDNKEDDVYFTVGGGALLDTPNAGYKVVKDVLGDLPWKIYEPAVRG